MKTIALRYTDKFAPPGGTIQAHREILNSNGFVWYGKLGNGISRAVAEELLQIDMPRFLLIRSGTQERYWVFISDIQWERPNQDEFPKYYDCKIDYFNTWFKVIDIKQAESNVMEKCTVTSSGAPLLNASKHSMSPYFIIEYNEKEYT